MKRGDLVVVSAPGSYGKPRSAVVVQSDRLAGGDSALVALCTSDIADAPFYRLAIDPGEGNGLRAPTQVMIDKILAIPRAKCSWTVGGAAANAELRSVRLHCRARGLTG